MVFGVFDGLHPGHRAFLRQAKRYGRELIAVVARNSAVRKLKNKKPKQNERVRLRAIRKMKGVSRAVLGDQKQGGYGVIRKYKPDVICLGYDQQRLGKDLWQQMRLGRIPRIQLVRLKSFRPEKFHTSKINVTV